MFINPCNMYVYLKIFINVGTFCLNKTDDAIIISFVYFCFEIRWNVLESLFYGPQATSGVNH